MKKIMCEKCGAKRGRRECIKYKQYICGDCCSSIQLNYSCPKDCIHFGKLNTKELANRINTLIDTGVKLIDKNPNEAVRVFNKVIEMDSENFNALYNLAFAYRNSNNFQEAIDTILKIQGDINSAEIDYLMGECYFMSGQFDKALDIMEKLISKGYDDKNYINKARIMLGKLYLKYKQIDKAVEHAELIDDDYGLEKRNIIENAYFVSGRMYELLKFISSMERLDYQEKFMLLQCALVLKKDASKIFIKIIDDILFSDYCREKVYERIWLIGLKIKFLFKEYRFKEAYEIFDENEDELLDWAEDISECHEACSIMAFFIYDIDKQRSVLLYNKISGRVVNEPLIDELYRAFKTMNISPYIMAKAMEKSIELIENGSDFNRTAIAADILYEIGEYSLSYEFYNRVLDGDTSDAITMYKMAVCLMKQDRYDEALDILTSIYKNTKFILGVVPGIIKCCLELNKEWIEYYKVLELEKLGFNETYELASSLMDKEYYDKAGYLYNYILNKFKNMDIYSRKMIYHNMALVYRNLKEPNRGLELISEIPQIYFGQELYVDAGCLYYDAGMFDRSASMFYEASKIKDNPIVDFNIGTLNMNLGAFEEALEYFNKSIDYILRECSKEIVCQKDIRTILARSYKNVSICLVKLDKLEDALMYIGKSIDVYEESKAVETLLVIQNKLLKRDKLSKEDETDINIFMDNCITMKVNFIEGIRCLLDSIIDNTYEKNNNKPIFINSVLSNNLSSFIKNERRIYNKNYKSIERSQGTFQRYVDNLFSSFEKKVVLDDDSEVAVTSDETATTAESMEYVKRLINIGDELFASFEVFDREDYVYSSLIPYFKAVKVLATGIIYPYYIKNIDMLPVPKSDESFKDIGIYSYKVDGQPCYRIDFSFNISSSEYLFDINCHPGLRNKYIDYNKHYMPWDKFQWILSGIKKKWNIVDDAKAAGLLLLFYCGYKNYMGIEGDFKNNDEIIMLAGDLIHLSNERDYCIRSMIQKNYEFDYRNYVIRVKELALRCIEGLSKIKRTDQES